MDIEKTREYLTQKLGYIPNNDEIALFLEIDVKQIEEAQTEISTELVAPTHIEVEVAFEDGKTIITYSGKATEKATNTEIDYNKELVFDFILTKEVNEN